MESEWCFEFGVTALTRPNPIPREATDGLLDAAIAWADARMLGSDYRPVTPEVVGAATARRLEFGLCVQEDVSLIPASQATELRELVRGWCESRGLSFADGRLRPNRSMPHKG